MAVLGIGNILLGSFKYEQYQNTLEENTQIIDDASLYADSKADQKDLSPLQRLKSTDHQSSRILALIRKAEARRDLYSLVIYGGKVFLLISSFLLTGAVIKRYFEDSTQSAHLNSFNWPKP